MRLALLLTLAVGLSAAEVDYKDPKTWLTYAKDLAGQRYSELNQINATNVHRLMPKWMYQTGVNGKFEATPLVFDGMMYVTAPSNHAFGIDLKTGTPIWHYFKKLPPGVSICCGQVNRGFATLGGKLFKLNLEMALVALDAKTGSVVWETQVDDIKKGYSGTHAPLIAGNKVIVGPAGAEFGIRGFLDAYDADTGKRLWRFWTIPAPGEPGSETWGGDSIHHGGGSIWTTGAYDPEQNTIYFGTGNPGPDYYPEIRPGDNLYSSSLVALDANTGKLKWHFQFTPHDTHDWDAIGDLVLANLTVNGQKVKAVIQANRNGFFYAIDRVTGKFLFAKKYVDKLDWADGIDAKGRPILIAGKEPTEEGNWVCPGDGGGHNWEPSAFSPQTGLYYTPSSEGCRIYYKTRQEWTEGQQFQGSLTQNNPTDPVWGSVVAIDPNNGEVKWKYKMVTPPSGGVLATGGGLVFNGDRQGYFMALDAKTGQPLWKFQTGGAINAGPISYLLNGKQYLAVTAGASVMTFGLPDDAAPARRGGGR
jgi:alcohol dehydrogenase (cytochrome c)